MPDGYRLFVNDERTVLARLWPEGLVEVATRLEPAHTWGAPVSLREEGAAAPSDGRMQCPVCGWAPGSGGLSREEQERRAAEGFWWCANGHEKRALVWVDAAASSKEQPPPDPHRKEP